ncbi:MAG: GNAT family N-acetyltransferase [Spirosomataceae bacterium]
MQKQYYSRRLSISEITLQDREFILELVNTPEWIRFIGERNVKTEEAAIAYIQKLLDNPNITYWVIKLKEEQTPIGVISFIKRDYLQHYDIGFALLAAYSKKGYAFEAVSAVLDDLVKDPTHTHILATTIKENNNSIRLIEKLGLRFVNEFNLDKDCLAVYSVTTDQLAVNLLTHRFYNLFTNKDPQKPDWDTMPSLCLPTIQIIKKAQQTEEVYDLRSFIAPRQKILSDGTLTDFEEYETASETRVAGRIAHRFSNYEKKGNLNGVYFQTKGHKLFQYVKTPAGWKISSVIWEDETV